VARGDQRQRRAHYALRAPQRRPRDREADGILPVLARAAREVEVAAQRGHLTASDRTKFQVVAVLARRERARVRAAPNSDSRRSAMLRRLDGIALDRKSVV